MIDKIKAVTYLDWIHNTSPVIFYLLDGKSFDSKKISLFNSN